MKIIPRKSHPEKTEKQHIGSEGGPTKEQCLYAKWFSRQQDEGDKKGEEHLRKADGQKYISEILLDEAWEVPTHRMLLNEIF